MSVSGEWFIIRLVEAKSTFTHAADFNPGGVAAPLAVKDLPATCCFLCRCPASVSSRSLSLSASWFSPLESGWPRTRTPFAWPAARVRRASILIGAHAACERVGGGGARWRHRRSWAHPLPAPAQINPRGRFAALCFCVGWWLVGRHTKVEIVWRSLFFFCLVTNEARTTLCFYSRGEWNLCARMEVACLASWLQKERASRSCCVLKIDDAPKSLCRAACCKIYPITFSSSFCLRARLSFPFNLALATLKWTRRSVEKFTKKQLGVSSGYFWDFPHLTQREY